MKLDTPLSAAGLEQEGETGLPEGCYNAELFRDLKLAGCTGAVPLPFTPEEMQCLRPPQDDTSDEELVMAVKVCSGASRRRGKPRRRRRLFRSHELMLVYRFCAIDCSVLSKACHAQSVLA